MKNCYSDPGDDVDRFRTLTEDIMRMSSILLVFVWNQVTLECGKNGFAPVSKQNEKHCPN